MFIGHKKTVAKVKVESATNVGDVTFSVASVQVPMFAIKERYCDKMNLPICYVKILDSHGNEIPLETKVDELLTPDSNTVTVVAVESVGKWQQEEKIYFTLNSIMNLGILRESTMGIPIPPEIFSMILSKLDPFSLLQCSQVNVYWQLQTLQISMLQQIELGLFAWHSKLNYPSWLAQMGEISWNLAMSSLEKQKTIRDKWAPLNLIKERNKGYSFMGNRPYQFTKAAGCIPVSIIEEIPEGKESTSHAKSFRMGSIMEKSHKRVQFLSAIEAKCKGPNYSESFTAKKSGLIKGKNNDNEQIIPKRGSKISIVPARHQKYCDLVIILYRKYFSPDMHYIFPLMVYKQSQFHLDFTNSETTLIFDDIPKEGPINTLIELPRYWGRFPSIPDKYPIPKGSVTWRFNQLDVDLTYAKPPASLLEVMFIAVWEQHRGHKLGSMLVEDLEKKAIEKGIYLMYVEIGYDQPKAKEFWGKNGFKRVIDYNGKDPISENDDNILFSTQQKRFCDTVCLRFSDTEQWAKILH